jgi:hypothetical protein
VVATQGGLRRPPCFFEIDSIRDAAAAVRRREGGVLAGGAGSAAYGRAVHPFVFVSVSVPIRGAGAQREETRQDRQLPEVLHESSFLSGAALQAPDQVQGLSSSADEDGLPDGLTP